MIRASAAATRAKTAAAASDRLTLALLRLTANGLRPPCNDGHDPSLWLSDNQDERAQAAALCQHCQVITECREATTAQREAYGVWGAVDFSRRTTGGTGGRETGPGRIRAPGDLESARAASQTLQGGS